MALQPFKLRVLKTLLLFGVIALVVIWVFESSSGLIIQLDRVAYPILVMVFISSLIAISAWPTSLQAVEWVSFTTFALYMIVQLLTTAFDYQSDTSLYSVASLAQWFPLVYIAAFIFFGTRAAVGVSIVIYMSFLIPIILRMAIGGPATTGGDSYPILVNVLLAHPVYVITLVSVAQLKTHLIDAQADASVMSAAANVDYLTGVANRRAAAHEFQTALLESGRLGEPLSVLLFDIDHFKQVNDRFGHDVGDQVLIELASALRGELRSVDTLGRWGGEEFIIIARQARSAEAAQLAERLRVFVAQIPMPQAAPITLSLGVSTARPGDTPESLVKRADEALYCAKQRGRNRVEVGE